MDQLLGQIQLFPYSFEILGWEPCEGQLISISQNPSLFNIIGTNFGGDGRTNFALPNLKGKAPIPDTRYFIAVEGIFPSRA